MTEKYIFFGGAMQEKNTLDELFKGKKGFAECYQTLQLLSESTDDY